VTHENPTLKIRVGTGNHWGASCNDVAEQIIGDRGVVLDAKWGREPTKWRETGRGWGRPTLTQRERGFVDAVESMTSPTDIETQLLAIVQRLTS
jgi:hypothetical protein